MNYQLSTKLDSDSAVPYFLWDEPMTIGELKKKLFSDSGEEKFRLLGKILREARDTDVWKFTSPRFVLENWAKIEKHLGRRREFWEFLFERWQAEGLIEK